VNYYIGQRSAVTYSHVDNPERPIMQKEWSGKKLPTRGTVATCYRNQGVNSAWEKNTVFSEKNMKIEMSQIFCEKFEHFELSSCDVGTSTPKICCSFIINTFRVKTAALFATMINNWVHTLLLQKLAETKTSITALLPTNANKT
jgi:hypothetical protein